MIYCMQNASIVEFSATSPLCLHGSAAKIAITVSLSLSQVSLVRVLILASKCPPDI